MSQSVFGRLRSKGHDHPEDQSGEPGAAAPMAGVDALTGLPDRSQIHRWAERAVERSHGSSTRALVIFVGVGRLRSVNDTYGPDSGDHLLREVAARLSTIDVPGTRVARWGGAEFALVFEKMGQSDAGERIGEFLVELLSQPFEVGHDSISIECVVGGAISDDSYVNQADLIRDAHQSVVEAHEQGPGAIVIWDESKRNRYATRITNERLQQAIDDEEFVLHWQPIVRIADRSVIGAESLIRWKAPNTSTVGVLFPNEFLPQLEASGLIVPAGKWVVRATCLQVAEWTRNNPDHRAVFGSCNLGARQLAQADFRDSVVSALEESGIEPFQLCLDLTAVALGYNKTSIWAQLRDLKQLGVKIGLDNLGSGDSSVGYLREFSVDFVHLASRFIRNAHRDREDLAIVRHLTALAHELDLTVVGQGVETEEEEATIRELGVDLGQGYLYGKPEYPGAIDLLLKPPDERRPTGWDPSEVMESSLLEHHPDDPPPGPRLGKG